MVNNNPKIAVIMPTYNGAEYLTSQLDSIFQQSGVSVTLFVRDDCSQDETLALIAEYSKRHDVDLVLLSSGEKNVGVYSSWEILFENVPREFDYYAISDQDDIWLKNKLSAAVEAIGPFEGPAIYNCGTTAVDVNGNIINKYDFSNRINSIESFFIRYSIPAHTTVFNGALMKLMDRYDKSILSESFTLEPRLFITCLACGGYWVNDPESYVLWRRIPGKNVTTQGNGLVSRLKTEIGLFKRKDVYVPWADSIFETFDAGEIVYGQEFLKLVSDSKNGFMARLRLFRWKNFKSGIPICDAMAKFRLLFPRW